MANNLNHQEEKFKHILENLELDVDTSSLWDSIESKVDKPKKRLGFLWMSLLVGLIVGGGLLSHLLLNQPNQVQPKQLLSNELSEANDLTDNSRPNTLDTESKSTSNLPSNKLKETHTELNAKFNTNHKNNTRSQLIKPTSSSTNTQLSTISNTTHTSTFYSQLGKDQNNPTVGNRQTIKSKTFDIKKDAIQLQEIGVLAFPLLGLNGTNDILLDHKTQAISADRASFKKSKLPHLFVAVKSGLNVSFSDPKLTQNVTNFNAQEFTKEEGLIAYDINLQVGKYWSHGWKISAGLGFNKQTIRYTNQESVIKTEEIEIADVSYDSAGNVTEVISTAEQTTTHDYDIRWHRNHKNINAELLIGKDLIHVDRWRFGLEGGYIFTLSSTSQGYYFSDTESSFNKITNQEVSPYRNKGLTHSQLGAYLEYRMGAFEIGFSPTFRYHLNSLTNDNHFYSLKNSQLGMLGSIKYTIGNY